MEDSCDIDASFEGFEIFKDAEKKVEVIINHLISHKINLKNKNMNEAITSLIGIEVLCNYLNGEFINQLEKEKKYAAFLFESLGDKNDK